MCTPKVRKQAPAALTTPTMQAADELALVTDGLQDNATGRALLRTGQSGARKAASASAASAKAALLGTSVPVTPSADAGTELGFGTPPARQGRTPGDRQPFYGQENTD